MSRFWTLEIKSDFFTGSILSNFSFKDLRLKYLQFSFLEFGKGISLGFLPTALLAMPFAILFTILFSLLTDRFIFRHY